MDVFGFYMAAIAGTAALGLASKWLDRKLTAMVQWRVGPPWYQPLADLCKLLGKETLVPETASRTVFLSAPLLGFAGAALGSAVLWVVNIGPASHSGFVGDFIAVLYLTALPGLALVIGGTAAGSTVSALGASREMKMILSYELPLILAACVALVKTSALAGATTLQLAPIITVQHGGSFILSVSGALALMVALICIQARLGLVPFDAAEAETEIIAGPYTEYSGPPLAMLLLTRAMMLVAMPLLLITLFWGGFGRGWDALWGIGKYAVILLVTILLRNTNPRLRIDQAMKFFWFAATPLAAIALALALMGW